MVPMAVALLAMICFWPNTWKLARQWRANELEDGDDIAAATGRRQAKTLVVAVLSISGLLIVGLAIAGAVALT